MHHLLTVVVNIGHRLKEFTLLLNVSLFFLLFLPVLYSILHCVHIIERQMNRERFRAHISVLEPAIIMESADGCLQRRG